MRAAIGGKERPSKRPGAAGPEALQRHHGLVNGGAGSSRLNCSAMRRAFIAIAWVLLTAVSGSAQARVHRAPAHARQPVVVELYTSQGCSSCVAADLLLDDLADRPGVLALTFAVDYWDYLGWNDTFAKPEFSARQRGYMQRLAMREVYTPQIIVGGQQQAAGADKAKVEALIHAVQGSAADPPRLKLLRHGKVQVGQGSAPPGGAEVWLVRYDPGVQKVLVKRGENRGQTLVERNVVRDLVKLGVWRGKTRVYAPPAALPDGKALRSSILLQAARSGRIIAVLQKVQ